MTTTALPARPVLADLVPGTLVRDVALVVGGALLTALCAQIEVPLPFTPVPLTAQTFGVLLAGAALGPLRGLSSQALYVLLGAAGLPFYSDGASGFQYLAGPTGGYLVGFVVAGALVGACARRGLDRRPIPTGVAFLLGHVAIFGLGVSWLAVVAGLDMGEALRQGLLPFIPSALVKSGLAAGVLPTAWRFLGDR